MRPSRILIPVASSTPVTTTVRGGGLGSSSLGSVALGAGSAVVATAPSSTLLIIAGSTQSEISSVLALIQQNALGIQNSNSSEIVSNVLVSQAQSLQVNSTASSELIGNITLAQGFPITIASTLQSEVISNTIIITSNSGVLYQDKIDIANLVWAHMDALSLRGDVSFIKDIEGGKWAIVGTQMIFYKADNITEVARFDLDNLTAPTSRIRA